MLLTIICSSLFLLSILWFCLDHEFDWCTDVGAVVSMFLTGITFIIMLMALFTGAVNTRKDIAKFEAVKTTIQQQRENKLTEYERATLTKEIVDQNEWLAQEQFWAKSKWLSWFYDSKILDLKPIQ